MILSKKHMYAIKVEKNQYIYFTFIAGNAQMGHILNVYDYKSSELEYDKIKYISQQKSLFPRKYIMGYIHNFDKNILTKVGKVDGIVYDDIKVFERSCPLSDCDKNILTLLNLREDYVDNEYYSALYKVAKAGEKIYCNNWRILEYGISNKGKLEFLNERQIGKLEPEYYDSIIHGSAFSIKNIIEYFQKGICEITAEMMIYR